MDEPQKVELKEVEAPKEVEADKKRPLTVTKNPKRVEQGKRLAEWNRKKKEAKKKKVELESVETTPAETVETTPNYRLIGGIVIVGGIAVGLIYFIQRGTVESTEEIEQPPKQEPKQEPIDDPFNMV